jgi:hypothetical protein
VPVSPTELVRWSSMRQRHALIARITQMRRAGAADEVRAETERVAPQSGALAALEARVAHMEKLVAGLQDSVHRESMRHSRQLAELESQIEPAAMATALRADARERGL